MTNRIQELFGLEGKTAVVTGGSRGIGEMIAEGFVDAGASVIITARKADELSATAERLSEKGSVTAVQGDLSTPDGRSAVAAEVPVGRIGMPDDMAGATIFLASRAGSCLTGTVIPVGGGTATAD